MTQADGLLVQTDDIYSVKLLGTSWLVHLIEYIWNPPPSPAPPV